jgi:hypothetical protein
MFQVRRVPIAETTQSISTALLTDGDDIVAEVHRPSLTGLFSIADEMGDFVRRMADAPCDRTLNGEHPIACRACEAKELLTLLDIDSFLAHPNRGRAGYAALATGLPALPLRRK